MDNVSFPPYAVSILWPHASHHPAALRTHLTPAAVRDLGLESIIRELCVEKQTSWNIEQVLLTLCQEPEVIQYRQDILEDFLTLPKLTERFTALFPIFQELSQYQYRDSRERTALFEVVWRMGELSRYIECIESLHEVLQEAGGTLRSEGLRRLREGIAAIAQDATFQSLVQELPALQARLNVIKSVTIGVNLDQHFHPAEATLVSVNNEPYRSASLLDKLFGAASETLRGIAPLHTAPPTTTGSPTVTPMMMPLFQDLAQILEKVCQPIAKALKQYVHFNGKMLAGLGEEVGFYLGAVNLIRRISKAGLPMCKPELAPQEERICDIQENFHLNLALHILQEGNGGSVRQTLVTNDVRLGEQGRIMILTGPNHGGKTTYIQAVGLTQILAQVGLYVPGKQARISPVDQIYTHFPGEEQLEKGTGRFGDEARRFRELFEQATGASLVLLNESLSSTSHSECLYLARDIVCLLRMMGLRAIFATHLHELAADIESIHRDVPGGSSVISMVASFIHEEARTSAQSGKYSYKVLPGPPIGQSYARELARQYGVSFEQLQDMLAKRGVVASEQDT